jgi:predicted metalloendopeptidase
MYTSLQVELVNWLSVEFQNPIPPEYSSWNTFIVLRDLNLDRLKSLLDELQLATVTSDTNPDLSKLSNYFKAFMDEDKIENEGLVSLLPLLSVCEKAAVSILLYLVITSLL